MKLAEPPAALPPRGRAFAIAGAVCFVAGVAATWYSLWWFALAACAFLAAIVLGIVAIARGNTGSGLIVVLLAVLVPLPLFFGLGWYRAREAVREVSDTASSVARDVARIAGLDRPGSRAASVEPVDPELAQYISSKLVVERVTAQHAPDELGERVPTVRFALHNRGTRTVDEVAVEVEFLDAQGEAVATDTYMPRSGALRLAPGERWAGDEALTSPHVPASWVESNVRARVTGAKFVE